MVLSNITTTLYFSHRNEQTSLYPHSYRGAFEQVNDRWNFELFTVILVHCESIEEIKSVKGGLFLSFGQSSELRS